MKKIKPVLVGLGTICAMFIAISLDRYNRSPEPSIDYSVSASAESWCEKRISELPEGDENRKFFEQSLQDIRNGNLRHSIDAPSGLHCGVYVCFALAWDENDSASTKYLFRLQK